MDIKAPKEYPARP